MPIEMIPWGTREEWLQRRIHDVTASDVAAVCGVSPFKTPLQVYAEKKRLIGKPDETNAMRRGLWLEPSGLFALQQTHPDWTVKKANVYVRDTDIKIGATPDFVAVRPDVPGVGNIQMKTAAKRTFEKWINEDGSIDLPLHYQLQTLTEATLMRADWAMVLIFIVSEFTLDLRMVEVPLHAAAWEKIKSDVAQFWWHMENDVPPPMVPKSDAHLLRKLYQYEDGESVDLSGNNELPGLLSRRYAITKTIKELEAERNEIEAIVMNEMKRASVGTLRDFTITWRNQRRKAYYVKEADVRVLKIKTTGED